MTNPSILKAVRLTHLYFGVFISPAVFFFAVSGFLQMFSFHESSRAPGYQPPAIIASLAQLHKNGTLQTGPPKGPATSGAPKDGPTRENGPKDGPPAAKAPSGPPRPPKWSQHLPMKLFFGLVAIGLAISTLTGLYMAWKYNRSKLAVVLTFLAGIAVPAVLLLF